MAEQSEARTKDSAPTRPTDATPSSGDARLDDRQAADAPVGFAYAPGAPVAGNPVLFEAESGSDGSDARYEWAFGDGATATGASASHVYDAPGEHEVALTVTGEGDTTRTTRRTVAVYREVPVEVGDADGDGTLAVTLDATDEFSPAEAVAVSSLRVGAPTAVAAGGGATPVRSEACDGDLRVRIPADAAGIQDGTRPDTGGDVAFAGADGDAVVRVAGHTTEGIPLAGTATVPVGELADRR